MIRKIIKINEEKCNGCGLCAAACHEGAIGMVDGKAKLLREDYCDGLGDCLPACPTGAITFEEREAPAYNEAAVLKSKAAKQASGSANHAGLHPTGQPGLHGGCPGSRMQSISHANEKPEAPVASGASATPAVSRLSQWPVQIQLVPINAPYFDGAKLLIAADCTAYAYAGFHEDFIKNHVTLNGCPKLDPVDYSEKLTAIIRSNNIQSVTIVRMEVPCCGGLEQAAKTALQNSGKFLPWQTVTISIDGSVIE